MISTPSTLGPKTVTENTGLSSRTRRGELDHSDLETLYLSGDAVCSPVSGKLSSPRHRKPVPLQELGILGLAEIFSPTPHFSLHKAPHTQAATCPMLQETLGMNPFLF